VPFSAGEIESYRQLVFNNLTTGMNYVFEAMEDMELKIAEENLSHMELIKDARDIREHEPFPMTYFESLKDLWADSGVQQAYGRGNEAALPEKCAFLVPCFVHLTAPITQPVVLFPFAGQVI